MHGRTFDGAGDIFYGVDCHNSKISHSIGVGVETLLEECRKAVTAELARNAWSSCKAGIWPFLSSVAFEDDKAGKYLKALLQPMGWRDRDDLRR